MQAIAYVEARGEQLEAEAAALEKTAPGIARGHAAARARGAGQGGQDGDQGRHQRGREPEVHVPVLDRADAHHPRRQALGQPQGRRQPGLRRQQQRGPVGHELHRRPSSRRSTWRRGARRRPRIALAVAEAELAAAGGDADKVKAAQAKIKAAKNAINMQDRRDPRHALGAARGEGQEGDLRARAQGAEQEGRRRRRPRHARAARGRRAAAGPAYYEEDEYTKRHPWSSPAYY